MQGALILSGHGATVDCECVVLEQYGCEALRGPVLLPRLVPGMVCKLLSTTFEQTGRGSCYMGCSYICRVLNVAWPPNWWQYRGSCSMSWCSWSSGGWALSRWARQATCSGSGTLFGEIWRIGTTGACSICIEKGAPRWPHCSYFPWIYQHPWGSALQFIQSIVGILGVAVPQYGMSLFPCFSKLGSLQNIIVVQPHHGARRNQSVNQCNIAMARKDSHRFPIANRTT